MMNKARMLMRVAMKIRSNKKIYIKKKTVTKTKPPPIKQKKKQQKRIIEYINS